MKTVLVSGCSSGIGRFIADGLKQKAYRVFTTARKQEDLDALSAAGFETIMLDLSDTGSIDNAVADLLTKADGQLYGLVNNAAYGLTGAVEDIPVVALRDQFETNIFGTQYLTNKLIPLMRKQKQGRIIQISSVLGFVTMKYRGAYCASKYALEALSDAMRYELADAGIKVSLIEPGPIKSEFRNTAVSKFSNLIDIENSHHQQGYNRLLEQMNTTTYKTPFTLGPEAVYKRVLHALESDKPKARYYVTFPTYLFACLKRILPGSLLDKILVRI